MKKLKRHPAKPRVRPELTIRHATLSGFPNPFLATPELVKVLEKGKASKKE
jgi:hypothetical protein